MTTEEASRACIEAAILARANARRWQAMGELQGAVEARERAKWYRELYRRRKYCERSLNQC
jgi:hypothetical protein